MIRVPLQMDAHVSIYALGRNEIDGPTDDLAVRIHLNDQEAGELSLKALVGEHLHNVVSFAETPQSWHGGRSIPRARRILHRRRQQGGSRCRRMTGSQP